MFSLHKHRCEVCGNGHTTTPKGVVLCCDGGNDCLNGIHLKCHNPPLDSVPTGDWFCSEHSTSSSAKKK